MATKNIQTVTSNGDIVPVGSVAVSALQPLTGTQVVNNFLKKLTPLHTENANAIQRVATYNHGVTAVNNAYQGGVYSPTQNRIYLVPYAQASQTKWHFIASTAQASLAPHYFGSTILSSTL